MDNLIAECELHPERLRHYFAELIRLREFAHFASRYRSLPLKVRESYARSVVPKAALADLVEAGAEEAIEFELHQPPIDKPPPRRTW